MSANSLSNPAFIQQPVQVGVTNNDPLRASALANLNAPQDTACFSGTGQPKAHVSKWEAAKKSMANSWYLGIPLGLASGLLSHHMIKSHLPEAAGKSALASGLIMSVVTAVSSWAFYGGVVGAITAGVANRKNKKDNQGEGSDNSVNPNHAFMWGAGLTALSGAATTALPRSGALGKHIKEATQSLYKTPKMMLPVVGMMALGSLTMGYVAKKSAEWVNRKANNNSSYKSQ